MKEFRVWATGFILSMLVAVVGGMWTGEMIWGIPLMVMVLLLMVRAMIEVWRR